MQSNRSWVIAGMGLILLVTGCAWSGKRHESQFDFSQVRRVSVGPFEGTGGQAVSDECVRQLIAAGIPVSDAQHPGDLILKGSVLRYNATHAAMVFLGNTTLVTAAGQTVSATNPVISLDHSQGTPEGTVVGARKSQITAMFAIAQVRAVALQPSSGKMVWSMDAEYEGMDMTMAVQSVVGSFSRPLIQRIMRTVKKPS